MPKQQAIKFETAREFVKQSLTDFLESAGFDYFNQGPSERGKSRSSPVFGAWRHRVRTVDWMIVDFHQPSRLRGALKHCCFDLLLGKFFLAIPSCGKLQASKTFLPSEGHFEGFHYGAIDYSGVVEMEESMQKYLRLLQEFLIPLFDHYEDINCAVGTLMRTAEHEPIGMKPLNFGTGLFNAVGVLSPIGQYYLAYLAEASGEDETAKEMFEKLLQEEQRPGGLRFPGFHREKYEEVQRRLAAN